MALLIPDKDCFSVLMKIKNEGYINQRQLSTDLDFSLGKTNRILSDLTSTGLLNEDFSLNEKGEKELEHYRVDNAIIMAAGMSSRFAPLSYELPKGVLEVNGEILIERQIRQLHEAGIHDITVVVGYMKERFFYLKEKFNVEIVVNEDYYRYNNTSSLIRVTDRLKNTYICSSDNYFSENPFEQYVYRSYYSAVYYEGKSDEWGLCFNKKGLITGIVHNPENSWCMMGHVYFSKEFSKKFTKILKDQYALSTTKEELWEGLYERNLKELDLYIRKYETGIIHEFDSIEELRQFDSRYISDSGSKIFGNICRVLKCDEKDIVGISVMKQGLTNLSFSFIVGKNKYVYRHPGTGTDEYISRKSEAFSIQKAAELGLDNTVIYMDPDEGWKISHFIEDARILDYRNREEVKTALSYIKKLHNAKIVSEYDFNIWKKTKDLFDRIDKKHTDFEDFQELFNNMKKLHKKVEQDKTEKILCHCDCYNPNFLLDKKDRMYLIDWEYSGNDDPANDIGTFICCSDYNYEEALEIIELYHGHKPNTEELRHSLAYVAIASFYWYVWAMFQESVGNTVGEYLLIWYDNAKFYMKKAMELYDKK